MRSIRASSRLSAAVRVGSSLAALACAACGCRSELAAPIAAAHPDDATPRRGGTLQLASFADIRGLDPAVASEGLSSSVIELLFAGLVDYDERGEVVADLAARWEPLEGGLGYRFFLREGVRMHDGEELTAEDVRRSVERGLHPTTPNAFASFYEGLVGFAQFTGKGAAHLEGVVVEGRYVVTFRLAEPDATFLKVLALQPLRPVCRSAGARYEDAWHPCGAGPFRLPKEGWERGRSVTVVRHAGYFRPGLPYLDAVTWTWNMNVVTERFKLERGEVDSMREFSQPDLMRLQADPRWRPYGAYEPDRSIYGQGMNLEVPPFDNVEVRRAVAAAIDRDKVRLVKPATVSAAYQPLPPAVPGYREDAPHQHHDLAAALEHMRKAGYPFDPATGMGGYPHVIPYYAYKQGLVEFTSQLLQQDLAKIGLRIEIRLTNFPTFMAITRRRGRVALAETGWMMDYPDASDFYEPLFTTKSINDEDSNNTAFYSNPRVDELVGRARRELEPKARTSLYEQAGAIVCDEAPWAFTHSNRWYDVWQPYVRGLRPHAVWAQPVGEVWLDREGERRAARGRAPLRDVAASVLGAWGRP